VRDAAPGLPVGFFGMPTAHDISSVLCVLRQSCNNNPKKPRRKSHSLVGSQQNPNKPTANKQSYIIVKSLILLRTNGFY